MSHSHPPYSGSSYANQDLRNRSFRGQVLNGADFSGSDICGCDFSRAQLANANFQQVKAGLSRRQQWLYAVVPIASFVLMANIVSQLVFGSLGQTFDDRAWEFVVALYVVLGLAGLGTAIRFWAGKHRYGHRAGVVSGILSAALVGFFYAGSSSGNNAMVATLGALVGGGFAAWVRSRQRGSSVNIATAAAGMVCAYGFSFWVGAMAIALLSVHRFVWGSLVSLLMLFCLWLTLACLRLLVRERRQAIGTCFRGADLTHARFDSASLLNTDFSRAIGYSVRNTNLS